MATLITMMFILLTFLEFSQKTAKRFITPLIVIDTAPFTVLFCNCPLLCNYPLADL